MLHQRKDGYLEKEEYLRLAEEIRHQPPVIDLGAMLFGACIITVPFFLLCTGKISNGLQNIDTISNINTRSICTDTYGRDANGQILNSDGAVKNPQTADDLPTHDITVGDIKPSPIDQHGTYGSAY